LLLAQHPQVATTRETHLFDGYLARLDQTWEAYKTRQAKVGLNILLSEQEFYDLCRNFANGVLDKIAAGNESATVILDKTPQHVRYAQLILKLIPDAFFIHIVRDPRSVVSSLRAAASSWASQWASPGVRGNARLWHSQVTAGREIGALTSNFREVRFEDLKGEDGPEILQGLFTWTGLPADAQFIQQALEACQIDNVREQGEGIRAFNRLKPQDPESLRKGRVDSWKSELSPRQIKVIEYINRDLMKCYGYELSTVTDKPAMPWPLMLAEVFDRADWRTRHTLERVRNYL
jgi:Sulfotransferase family